MSRQSLTISALLLFACLSFAMPGVRAGELSNLTGNWSGNWSSEISNHKGPLKAKFKVLGEDKVEAKFTGRFFKLIPFKFTVTLDVVSQKDGTTKLQGKHDLGRTLGVYHYDVNYEGDSFIAKYHTDKDKGVFEVSKK